MKGTKSIKNSLKIIFCGFLLSAVCGCATGVPQKDDFPICRINGTRYYALVSLCDARGIDYRYDEITRIVILTGNRHKINLRVGDGLMLLDGKALKFNSPVDIYEGRIVVPEKLKEEVLDRLFKKRLTRPRAVLPISKIKKVVIDPGHGGRDPGAISRRGLKEKDVNLDIAKRLHNLLRGKGVEVIMTRTQDVFVDLAKRARIANDSGADLFISIHANANRARSMEGFEVYYVAPNVGDSKRAYSSAKNAALNFDRACFLDSSLKVKAIVWDMVYTHARAEAIELSHSICRSAQDNLGVKILGVKKARFIVLKDAFIPAVLVEVGFLSNSREERKLNDSCYRQKIAESITEGVRNYGQAAVLMEATRR